MAQHDYDISNASGATVRADLNSVLDAIVDNNSGNSAPSTTFANMWWYDTSNSILKVRNAANNAWVRPLVGQQTIWIPAGAMTSRTTDGADSGSFETGTNKVMVQSFDFDTSTDEFVQFAIQMPEGWDEGTLIAQFIWSHPSTTTNFGVRFFIQAVALADDDGLDTAFGTAIGHTADTGGTTDDIYITPETTAITVDGSPAAEEYVVFQVYRDVSDGGDTLAVDARLAGIKIHYTTSANTDD